MQRLLKLSCPIKNGARKSGSLGTTRTGEKFNSFLPPGNPEPGDISFFIQVCSDPGGFGFIFINCQFNGDFPGYICKWFQDIAIRPDFLHVPEN